MNILALDTAASACSAALWQDGEIIAHQFVEMKRGHAEALLPMVEHVLNQAGLTLEKMDAIGVSVGPGAFTGLRIAMATARGFGVARGLPVVGVTTLETLHQAIPLEERAGRPVLCALDAKRADLYVQIFDGSGQSRLDPLACLPQKVPSLLDPSFLEKTHGSVLIAGDSFERLSPHMKQAGFQVEAASICYPDARAVCELVAQKGPDFPKDRPSPFYIRPPDAAIPKNQGRLRP